MQANEQSSKIVGIYNSRFNVLNQLENQGYDTSNYNEFSINEVNIMSLNKQLDMIIKHGESNKKVFVKYFLHKSLRDSYIYEIIEDLFNLESLLDKDDRLIIIAKDDPNQSLISFLKQIYSDEGYFISIISLKRLQYNLLEHEIVPKHRILDDDEKKNFCDKYGIKNNGQIPEISRFDPVAQAIGLKPNDICHIQRRSKISVQGDYYRYCIND